MTTHYCNMHGGCRLTIREMENLLHALANTTSASDAMEAVFQKTDDRNACYSAQNKLQVALNRATLKKRIKEGSL